MFDDLFDFLKDLWNEIRAVIDDIIAKIKEILPYLILIAALYVGFGGVIWGLTGWGAAALFIGASYLVLPDETAAMMTEVAAAVGEVVEDVATAVAPIVDAVGGAISTVASSVFGALGPWLIGGGLIYLYMTSDKDKDSNSAPRGIA